ncbi:hypothetical protein CTAM01_04469 [Colletotrichum tamarilloi]|uniref:Uncharacterized protein n=1 Tax=Colletotrichum tamarilloi TaxID=1209934 RepID=A0ABQ9RIA8_9PEZI|nr:uncharacterized protein CTAM01_04469 [Colletotrichum tamarilloi]KAK1504239.1 hypothetical protein CTAM01_04469 [Colletotrichum tamarilloi]
MPPSGLILGGASSGNIDPHRASFRRPTRKTTKNDTKHSPPPLQCIGPGLANIHSLAILSSFTCLLPFIICLYNEQRQFKTSETKMLKGVMNFFVLLRKPSLLLFWSIYS